MTFDRTVRSQFIEDVEAYMGEKSLDDVMGELQRRYGQYKRLEAELQQTRIRLSNQLPDVKRSLEAVVMLCEKRDSGDETSTTVKYQLTEATFADAEVVAPESVYLWLGANVMLEYPLDEAKELLETNAKACESGLEANTRDLAVLKDNITIMEVNMARLYNHDVRKKRTEEAGAGKK
jgi:prefoldin subunit 5